MSQIPDPRHRRGTVYSLASVLTSVALALLCGRRSLAAIAEWGRHYNPLAPLLRRIAKSLFQGPDEP